MNKTKDLLTAKSVAYHSSNGGFEVKALEFGINDYLFGVSGCWVGSPKLHKLKIYHSNSGKAYVKLNGYTMYLSDMVANKGTVK